MSGKTTLIRLGAEQLSTGLWFLKSVTVETLQRYLEQRYLEQRYLEKRYLEQRYLEKRYLDQRTTTPASTSTWRSVFDILANSFMHLHNY
jgi:HEPN domain-containing protein